MIMYLLCISLYVFLMVLVKIHWLYLMFIWNYRVLKDF